MRFTSGLGSLNCTNKTSQGGVGFLVRECLISEVEFITSVRIKVWGERGRSALYIGCVCMPTESTSVAAVESCYGRLKEDVLSFREKVVGL